ncbi:tetratricopeptide repeat protein [Streptomyces albidoflavus]
MPGEREVTVAGRGPTRQELIRRQRRSGFVGRRDEQALFREALQQPPEEATQFLFHIHGPGGVGKSTLARQLESAAREAGAITAYVDESVADPVEAMEAVSEQLTTQGAPSKEFDKAVAAYRQRRHEADSGLAEMGTSVASPDAGASAPAPSPSSMIVSQLGLAGLGMVPGVGAFAGAVSPGDLAAGADRLKAMLGARLRNHDDVRLVLSPLETLTPAFLNGLTDAARNRPWVVLIFDTYERTGPLLDTWLRDVLVTEKYGAIPANVLVVLAGQSRLDVRCWGDWLDLVTNLPLKVFNEDEARHLLAARGITDEPVVTLILKLSERLPVLVSMLAEAHPADPAEVNDPSDTAVERFLKWESDPTRRAAALACALPLDLDEDILRAAVDAEAPADELFAWLRALPFVRAHSGRFVYHDVVRKVMLRLQRQQSPERWRSQHLRLADAYERRLEVMEASLGSGVGHWEDEHWRAARLHRAYHRLCADPRGALPGTLGELVSACLDGHATLHRWAGVLTRAGLDTESSQVSEVGRRLDAALGEPAPTIAVLTFLLSETDLTGQKRALAHSVRGSEYRRAEQHEQAVADYGRAITLGLEGSIAHIERGLVYLIDGQLQLAVADFTSVLEAEPEYEAALGLRALTYRNLNQYEEAIADLDRVLALDPDHALALTDRGVVHQACGRSAAALADFDQALTVEPDNPRALVERAAFHHTEGHLTEALADLDRALTVEPDDAYALTLRSGLHVERGRHTEALADLDRALTVNPESRWTLIRRASAHHLLGDLDAAATDYTRLLEIDPTHTRALLGRADTHRLQNRPSAALADLNRCLEASPDDEAALARRGHVHRLSGLYEDALADLDRVVELGHADGEIHLERAVVLHALGAPDSDPAVAHATELLESEAMAGEDTAAEDMADDLDAIWGELFLVHCLTPDWDKADRRLADFLAAQPLPGHLAQLLFELTALAALHPESPEHFSTYQHQLSEALASAREAVQAALPRSE